MTKVFRNLWNLDRSRSAAPHIEIADTLWKRSIGLIGRQSLEADSGLWLAPCNGIHTFGMRFPIDVLFLNDAGEVMHMKPGLKPWRICGIFRLACVVIELPEGAIATTGITIGTRLMLNNATEPVFPEIHT